MRFDVAVLGAGPAGMIAMLRLAASGLRVLGLERNAPANVPQDLRSTAFLAPAITVLEEAGVWARLGPYATPLDAMEIVDAAQAPLARNIFHPTELGAPHFGHNVMNRDLQRILRAAIMAEPRIDLRYGVALAGLRQMSEFVELALGDGARLGARLVIGADGRNSSLRQILGIGVKNHIYDQAALVTTIGHELPHRNISTEVHLAGGPFTTVPIADVDGHPASALVWLDHPDQIATLRAIDAANFNAALNARSAGIRGQMWRIGATAGFPMQLQSARRLHDHRAVLIGEAAHVVPPIGAQGLNMSLKDIDTLRRAIETGALENPRQLDGWARSRMADIALRKRGIDALNRVSIGGFVGVAALRKYGLIALGRDSVLRRGLMRRGMGV